MSGMEVSSPLQLLTPEKNKDRDSESPPPYEHSPWSQDVTSDNTWSVINGEHQLRQRHREFESIDTNGYTQSDTGYQDSLIENEKKVICMLCWKSLNVNKVRLNENGDKGLEY